MRGSFAYRGVAALAFVFAFMPVEYAQACGGFFCDSPGGGQPPMPVDQTGETIVFAFDGENVEAHIQIQYTGDPERFAWLIPLQTTPEITVGSAQLFMNLLNSTVPSVSLTQTFTGCFQSLRGRRRLRLRFGRLRRRCAPASGFASGSRRRPQRRRRSDR